ncbi:pyrimidine/purine nucleoside phosphorylase [Faucicola mancuniensis]|uniref:pyrimidine/purine nucleoside phosphorylase n=1 Tax=Faucicola mancuniensis TaxID=1309795 RepID=UPI0028F062A9|nr:pyrimidine/purine nucleoside phosphorylase [uncultured Moraxella sp.]
MLKVNQYFDGAVASIGFQTATLPATVGVMKIGEYEFGTSQFETMTVVSGEISALLPNQSEWQTFKAFDSFTIEANQKFKVKVAVESAYLCTYEDK